MASMINDMEETACRHYDEYIYYIKHNLPMDVKSVNALTAVSI